MYKFNLHISRKINNLYEYVVIIFFLEVVNVSCQNEFFVNNNLSLNLKFAHLLLQWPIQWQGSRTTSPVIL